MFLENKPYRIHFIGADGASMSALAKLMLLDGKLVTGSDLKYGRRMEELNEWGARVYLGSDENVIKNSDLVVYSQAIPPTDEELESARKYGVKTIRRDWFLGEFCKKYDYVTAVAGTHGKTTTSAMIAKIYKEAGLLYTAHIGGDAFDGGSAVYKGDNCIVTEACEYKRSFLALSPDVAVILNVELDHPDTYRSDAELYDAFMSFICGMREGGVAVVNADTEFYRMHKCTYKPMVTFGIENTADCGVRNIELLKNGRYGFRIVQKGYRDLDIRLRVAGYHNIYNALASCLASRAIGVNDEAIKAGLEGFCGVGGRYEYRGTSSGADIYIDYAHHPTEIRASIKTAEISKGCGRIITVFQPHTLSRTAALYKDFVTAFCDSDETYILKEYGARERTGGASAYDLYKGIVELGQTKAYYYDTHTELAKALASSLRRGDTLLILGAGDVDIIAELLHKPERYD